MNKVRAFTMAEMLIALSLIGILAILMISGVRQEKHQKQLNAALYDKVYDDVYTATKSSLTIDLKNTKALTDNAEELRDTITDRLDVASKWESGVGNWKDCSSGIVKDMSIDCAKIKGATLTNGANVGFINSSSAGGAPNLATKIGSVSGQSGGISNSGLVGAILVDVNGQNAPSKTGNDQYAIPIYTNGIGTGTTDIVNPPATGTSTPEVYHVTEENCNALDDQDLNRTCTFNNNVCSCSCNAGYELSKTGGCIQSCADGQTRDERGDCVYECSNTADKDKCITYSSICIWDESTCKATYCDGAKTVNTETNECTCPENLEERCRGKGIADNENCTCICENGNSYYDNLTNGCQQCPEGKKLADDNKTCVCTTLENDCGGKGTYNTNTCQCDCESQYISNGKMNAEASCGDCKPGEYKNGDTCVACEEGFYCPGGDEKIECPKNSTTVGGGAKDRSECTLCSENFYGKGPDNCSDCPAGAKSNAGSKSKDDCKCDAGYYLNEPNWRCDGCPDGAKSNAGSKSKDDCKCDAGYYLNGESCVICPKNHYCSGDNSGKSCPDDKPVTDGTGKTSVTDCKTCAEINTMTPSFNKNTGECVSCQTFGNNYYAFNGNCIPCYGIMTTEGCVCPPGYTVQADGTCDLNDEVLSSTNSTCTKDDIPIFTADQLASIGFDEKYPLNGNYCLRDDLDLSAYGSDKNNGHGWLPIAYNSSFTGIFNGDNHEIENLYIKNTDVAGLFSVVSGTIKNLGIEGEIKGDDKTNQGGTGGLVGKLASGGKIQNSHSSVAVHGYSDVGSLVGITEANTTIEGSYSTGEVGWTWPELKLNNCFGGLVGTNNGLIKNSYSTGGGGWDRVGGFVGCNNSSGIIENSYAESDVHAQGYSGGFVGENKGTIENTYHKGNFEGTYENIGGYAGINSGTIKNSYIIGNVNKSGDYQFSVYSMVSSNSGTIINSYYNSDNGGVQNGAGVSKSNFEMKNPKLYTDAGWSENVWCFNCGSYPLLKNMPYGAPDTSSCDNSCPACEKGSYLNDKFECQVCATGYTTSIESGATSAEQCDICKKDYYMKDGSCEACPNGATTQNEGSISVEQCSCSKGKYMQDGECESCPGGSTTYNGMLKIINNKVYPKNTFCSGQACADYDSQFAAAQTFCEKLGGHLPTPTEACEMLDSMGMVCKNKSTYHTGTTKGRTLTNFGPVKPPQPYPNYQYFWVNDNGRRAWGLGDGMSLNYNMDTYEKKAICVTRTKEEGSTSINECFCNKDSYMNNGECKACPEGSTTTAEQGATSVVHCDTCDAGYYWHNGACEICPENSYCEGGERSVATECVTATSKERPVTKSKGSKTINECISCSELLGIDNAVWDEVESECIEISCPEGTRWSNIAKKCTTCEEGMIPIYTAKDLDNVRNNLSGSYCLMNDIDLEKEGYGKSYNSGKGWEPIGQTKEAPFIGKLNGDNHTIKGLYISRESTNYSGLFGRASSAEVKNINLTDVDINGYKYTGALIGFANNSTSITNTSVTGKVNATSSYVGGLIGYTATTTSIDNSYSEAEVTATGSEFVGGFVGLTNDSTLITNSYATGKVQGKTSVGGFVGSAQSTSNIENSYATGEVEGSTGSGGFVGFLTSDSTIKNSYSSGNVTGSYSTGGFAGTFNGTIENSYATGEVKGGSSGTGGFIGYSSGGSVKYSYATGSVSGTKDVGGFIGSSNSSTVVENSYATGSAVATAENAGGFFGYFNSGRIENSYATGGAEGTKHVGGLVGYTGSGSNKIIDSYAAGTVSGNSQTSGGLVGYYTYKNVEVTNSFYDKDTTNQPDNGYGTPKSTVEMKNPKMYTDAGWSENAWCFNCQSYPHLKNMPDGAEDATSCGNLCPVCGENAILNNNYECVCEAGYGGVNCDPCEKGSYSTEAMVSCESCPEGSTTSVESGATSAEQCDICKKDYYMQDDQCKSCPDGSTTTVESGATSIEQCSCSKGKYMQDGECKSCPDGSTTYNGILKIINNKIYTKNEYCKGKTCNNDNERFAAAQEFCTGLGGYLPTDTDVCEIVNNMGYGHCGNPNKYESVFCKNKASLKAYGPIQPVIADYAGAYSYYWVNRNGQNTYWGLGSSCSLTYYVSGGAQNAICVTRTKEEGSTSIDECRCSKGKYMQDGECKSCPDGSTTTVESGATSIEQCSCSKGKYMQDGECKSCPDGSATTVESGATSIEQCSCSKGKYMQDGECKSCPDGSTTTVEQGATSVSQCDTCVAGYYYVGNENKPCEICPENSYCEGGEKSVATECISATNKERPVTLTTGSITINECITCNERDGVDNEEWNEATFACAVTSSHDCSAGYIPIFDKYDLMNIGNEDDFPLDGCYILMNDIDLSSVSYWNSIGRYEPFTGVFDGNNHTIRNLKIIDDGVYDVGLFGNTESASIKDLGVVNVDITTTARAGAITGIMSGGEIINSYSTGKISSNSTSGGLVAYVFDGTIENSYSTVNISSEHTAGGLVGDMSGGTIKNSHTSSTVFCAETKEHDLDTGGFSAGGLVGEAADINIINSYSTGNVSGLDNVGGLVGTSWDSVTISNSYTTNMIISGEVSVGGLVGDIRGNTEITGSYSKGQVVGTEYSVGGLVGALWSDDSEISKSYTKNIYVVGNASVGGLVGTSKGKISKSYADAQVICSDMEAGGLVGEMSSFGNPLIESSFAKGSVTGVSFEPWQGLDLAGGLVGSLSKGKILDSYSTVTVKGYLGLGGLVGGISDGGYVENSYAIGQVISTAQYPDNVGGLSGSSRGTIINSYYNKETTGMSDRGKGEPKTTEEMKNTSIYTSANWDEENWCFSCGEYPILTDMPEGAPQSDSCGNLCGGCNPQEGEEWSTATHQCECMLGYEKINDKCFKCETSCPGNQQYKNNSCQCECGIGYYLKDNVCTSCPTGSSTVSKGATDVSQCNICSKGYYWNNGSCVLCEENYYCLGGENANRIECASATNKERPLTSTTGSKSSDECISCNERHGVDNEIWSDKEKKCIINKCTIPGTIWNDDLNRCITTDYSGSTCQAGMYIITTAEELTKIGQDENYPSWGQYCLKNDLNLSDYGYNYDNGRGWKPIGKSPWSSYDPYGKMPEAFMGTLNGDNHTIEGLYIARSSDDNYSNTGLFGYASGATFKNINLENVYVSGYNEAGGLVGYAENSTIDNVSVSGSVSGSMGVGGIVGDTYSTTITNSHSSCSNVYGSNGNAGGLVGYGTANISNSYSTCSYISGGDGVGGLIGNLSGGSIENSYAKISGSVYGNNYVGGLAGGCDGSISRSFASASVYGKNEVGGLVGRSGNYYEGSCYSSLTVTDTYAEGYISGSSYVGGLVGNGSCASIYTSYSTAYVSGYYPVGGLVGEGWSVYTSYYNSEASNQSDTGKGEPKTTEEMKNTSIYTNPTGPYAYLWSSSNWCFNCGQYPLLKNMPEGAPDTSSCDNFCPLCEQGSYFDNNSFTCVECPEGYTTSNSGATSINECYNSGNCKAGYYRVDGYGNGYYSESYYDYYYGSYYSSGYSYSCEPCPLNSFCNYNQKYDCKDTYSYTGEQRYLTRTTLSTSSDDCITCAERDGMENSIYNEETQECFAPCPVGIIWDNYTKTCRTPYNPDYPTTCGSYMIAISTPQDLFNITSNPSESYCLVNDIDLTEYCKSYNSEQGCEPIGFANEYYSTYFSGVLNGDNHTIKGLYINRGWDYVGLFSQTQGARFYNLNLENVNVSGGYSGTGGLTGLAYGDLIDNVTVSGNVYGSFAGCIVGSATNSTSISNSSSSCEVTGSPAGGIAGNVNNGTIDHSYATGSVYGGSQVGGITGDLYYSTINNSYATGAISGSYDVGGLVGFGNTSAIISNSYATGNVSGTTEVGGLAGTLGVHPNCYNDCINSCSYYGGDCSYCSNQCVGIATITNSYATGHVEGGDYTGGLFGYVTEGSSIENSYYDKDTTGQSDTGKGEPKLTSEMKNTILYKNGGWSSSDWYFNCGSYPLLRNMPNTESYPEENLCSACPADSYANDNLSGCNTCPEGSTTTQGVAATSIFDCKCPKGTYLNNGSCTSCPEGSTTTFESGATSVSQCDTCDSGYYWNNGACEICPLDNYCAGGELGVATECLSATSYERPVTLTTGSKTIDECITCNELHGVDNEEWDDIEGKCNVPCPTGTEWNPEQARCLSKTTTESTCEAGAIPIFTAEELASIGQDENYPLEGSYCLMNDIDLSAYGSNYDDGKGWKPIGIFTQAYGKPNKSFIGSFNGDNHTISGLYINRPDEDEVGLFGYLKGYSTIKNIKIYDAHVKGHDEVGSLIGYAEFTTVTNTYTTGEIQGQGAIGGLAGNFAGGSISNSYSGSYVQGTNMVGGFAGATSSTIENVYFTGEVEGNKYVGGLVGAATHTIVNSYVTGRITGSSETGGLVGSILDTAIGLTVTNSYYDKETTGQSDTGKGEPKTTFEMKNTKLYKDAGWSGDIWYLQCGIYPLLRDVTIENFYPDRLCPVCVENATLSANFSCQCNAGYSGNGKTCTACTQGFYATETMTSCAECPDNTTTISTASIDVSACNICKKGFYMQDGRCIACPNGSTTTVADGATSIEQCTTCNSGYYWNNGTCEICPENYYCEGGELAVATECYSATNTERPVTKTPGSKTIDECITCNTRDNVENEIWDDEFGACHAPCPTGTKWNKEQGKCLTFAREGSTCESDMIPIFTAEDLDNIRHNLSGNYCLMNDIDIEAEGYGTSYDGGRGWNPIGTFFGIENPFHGTLNGDNHKIKNLYIKRASSEIGIFAYTRNATVKNLGIEKVTITNEYVEHTPYFIGGLIAQADSTTIDSVYITGKISGVERAPVGGLVADAFGGTTITNSHSECQVSGSSVGGLVWALSGSITNSYATGSVTGNGTGITGETGGLVASVDSESEIKNSYAKGSVKDVSGNVNSRIGGLIGDISGSNIKIEDSYATGRITGNNPDGIGGLIGLMWGTDKVEIKNSYATGDVTANEAEAGGLIGEASGVTLTNVHASGRVITKSFSYGSGGLVGVANEGTIITKSYATGNVQGGKDVGAGGLVGWLLSDSTIKNSYAIGTVDAGSSGGLVGQSGNLTASESNMATIENSYATSRVYGDYGAGGLVGIAANANIKNSYATGDVSCPTEVGGLVGRVDYTVDIKDSYSVGNVQGDTRTGGLIGCIQTFQSRGNLTISNSYYNRETSNQSDTGKGEPKTTEEMQNTNTYSGWSGDIWCFNCGSYPHLKDMPEGAEDTSSCGNMCTACAENATVGSDFTCQCKAGYAGDGIVCEACEKGSYATETMASCTPCTDNFTTSVDSGATSAEQCNICAKGYYMNNGVCTVCPNGSTTTVEGGATSVSQCNTCAEGYYWNNGTCEICPENYYCDGGELGVAVECVTATNKERPTTLTPGAKSIDECISCNTRDGVDNEIWDDTASTCVATSSHDCSAGYIPIYNKSDLMVIGRKPDYPLDGCYILMDDIDLSSVSNWTSIGYNKPFTGVFDGNNHTIKNLKINGISISNRGLFGNTDSASIKNLGVVNVNITANISYTGVIVGTMTGGEIINSYSTGEISSTTVAGGLVGNITGNGTIENSYSTVNLSSDYIIGGLVGEIDGGTIKNSHTNSTVFCTDYTYAGGLVGEATDANIINSYSEGSVSSFDAVGGLVGSAGTTTISNSYTTNMIVSGAGDVGGLVGCAVDTDIIDSYSEGQVVGTEDNTGGLVGTLWEDSEISKSYTKNIQVTGNYEVGGLVGLSLGKISKSYADVQVICNGKVAGGLVGEMDRSSSLIESSFAKGSITGTGGLVNMIGGLVGSLLEGKIINSYANVTVEGHTGLGGLVGSITKDGYIENSYATGQVISDEENIDDEGGLVGGSTGGNIKNSYYDKDTSTQTDTGKGTPKSTTEMKNPATFVGWDTSIWELVQGAYPKLKNVGGQT